MFIIRGDRIILEEKVNKQVLYNGNLYEWDSNKERINIQKHKVSFVDVLPVFSDKNKFEFPDKCVYEDRWDVIGMSDKVYYIVYTQRKENTTRIISARRATKKEEVLYEYGIIR